MPLLLFAEPLQRAGLRSWLEETDPSWRVHVDPACLEGSVRLVIWSLPGSIEAATLQNELRLLQERWQPAPVLLLLEQGHRQGRSLLLRLGVAGLLEAPSAERLGEAVRVLLGGGRVLELNEPVSEREPSMPGPVLGLGGWLLLSGLQQIDAELRVCRRLLDPPPDGWLALLLLQGRERELLCARQLLLWLWGPAQMAWGDPVRAITSPPEMIAARASHHDADAPAGSRGSVAITLRERSADGLWSALRERLEQETRGDALNRSGQLLALEGLAPDRRRDLLMALLEQFAELRERLRAHINAGTPDGETLLASWRLLQPELRRTALRRLAGTYVQLPLEGVLTPVADRLLAESDLSDPEPELPEPESMLTALVQATPLLVEGRLLPPDEPEALLYLELLLANWLIRNAERISAEVLAACAEWPELR
ncbi:MAG: DUF3685 domain-containing protein, partial [Cyanobium sp.]